MSKTREEILKARAETMEVIKAARKEIAAAVQQTGIITAKMIADVFGEPYDELKPTPDFIGEIAEYKELEPGIDAYYFNPTSYTKTIYYINANGSITNSQVTPQSKVSTSLVDNITPNYWVAWSDLLTANYDVLTSYNGLVARGLDDAEKKKAIKVIDTGIPSGNKHVLGSGNTKFKIQHLWDMRKDVKNYGDNYVLLVGDDVEDDIRRWDYDENKYHSIKDMLEDLKVTMFNVFGDISVGDQTTSPYTASATSVNMLRAGKAILIATSTATGRRPVVFYRRILNALEYLQGTSDEAKRRVYIQPSGVLSVGSAQKPATAVCGFESIQVVLLNTKAVSGFYRSASFVAEA